jgi:hypothetical protein
LNLRLRMAQLADGLHLAGDARAHAAQVAPQSASTERRRMTRWPEASIFTMAGKSATLACGLSPAMAVENHGFDPPNRRRALATRREA